ncbi:MAG: YdcF family protein [Lachnospiraceae bacterium]|nr:YdcF family protein [Lachnospiraceae bacterium]
MTVLRVISLFLGVACIVLFMPPLVMYRILNIGNATGLLTGLVLIVYGLFAGVVNRGISSLWSSTSGKVLVCLAGCLLAAALIMAIIISMLILNAAGTKPAGNETLIILGCQVKGTKPSLMLTERLNAAKTYMDEHKEVICILSGGKGEDEGISEALCMYNYLIEHGVDENRLIMEDRSTSTRENLKFSMDIINEQGLKKDVAIVTNEFHEYRAFKIAEKLGLNPKAVPARTHWWLFSTYFVREWYGVISLFFS